MMIHLINCMCFRSTFKLIHLIKFVHFVVAKYVVRLKMQTVMDLIYFTVKFYNYNDKLFKTDL